MSESHRIEYLDFEIEIGPGGAGGYPVAVLRSPAGEPRGMLRLPFEGLELENKLQSLRLALLSSSTTVRRMASPEDATVERFGGALFDSLFAGDVRSCLDVSRRDASATGKGLRIKLRIKAPEVATLPWEFMYDGRAGEYLSLSKYSPIVRYLELATPVVPLEVDPPLQLLAMVASPEDLPALNVERERLRVETALSDLAGSGVIEVEWILDGSWRTLQRRLDEGTWHLFHFSGHGRFDAARDEGTVALVDEHGGSAPFSATQLARMLADHPTLRLVVLNACEGATGGSRDIFSGTASILVRRGIPAVLAMQYEIGDAAAVEFARTFYESVARGMPIDAGVAESRKAISFARGDSLEWGTPVLYTRAPDGVLFRLDTARLPAAPTPVVEREPMVEREPQVEREPPIEPEPLPEPEPPIVPEPWPPIEPEPVPQPEPPIVPEPIPEPVRSGAAPPMTPVHDGAARAPAGSARRRTRLPLIAAVVAILIAVAAAVAFSAARGGDPDADGGRASGGGAGASSAETLTLEDAALDGSYAMEMTLIDYRNGPQSQSLWGADPTEREIGRVWPAEDWLFSSTCYPEACDTEVTVEGRGKKAWVLTKEGRAYADVAEGFDCDGTVVTRALNLTVSGADTVGDVYTATNVEGRLIIQMLCPGNSEPERATFSLSGTLNA
ncbi:MAG: CHAT domain-containing protein [Actinomycetota bacterium]